MITFLKKVNEVDKKDEKKKRSPSYAGRTRKWRHLRLAVLTHRERRTEGKKGERRGKTKMGKSRV